MSSSEDSPTKRQQIVNTEFNIIKDFVTASKGTKPIQKILIANNGMAAVKAIRSIRMWAYEMFANERIFKFIAMATPEDLEVNAEYIRMADHVVEVRGGSSQNNYANVELIVDLAERLQVDGVYVGWGFASENPVLAERLLVLDPPVIFIGPPPSAMRSLGDKIASTIVAQSAGVPCVDWSGKGIHLKPGESGSNVPDQLYRMATTATVEEGLAHANRIGYPVMIKASEGGGGKGIRLVYEASQFHSAFRFVQQEMPRSPIFVMQLVKAARHLEIQLLADEHGNAIALFGRDCTVQRRHQKILEEAPITVALPPIIAAMEAAAVNLAKLVGYTSAGTVEYLYEPVTQKFHFLELNPRLQVEHPTTEMISGVNIPAAQLQIAMGIPLSSIKDIRLLYGLGPNGNTMIDFEFNSPSSDMIQRRPRPTGHVIAARITAENPEEGFKPNSGKIVELNFKSNSNVWGYFSVNGSGGVHEYADSQFGHLFAYGNTRESARKSLVMALKEVSIRGEFRTTVEYLVKLLETGDYVSNEISTAWLDELIASKIGRLFSSSETEIFAAICGGFAKTFRQHHDNNDTFLSLLERGKIPPKHLLNTNFEQHFIINKTSYIFTFEFSSDSSIIVGFRDKRFEISGKSLRDGAILVQFDGQSRSCYLKEDLAGTHLIMDGKSFLLETENDPTKVMSPSPGKLIRYLVSDGERITEGGPVAEIEVMKMYLPIVSKYAGRFTALKPVSSLLSNGEVIGNLELESLDLIEYAKPFDGTLPDFRSITLEREKPHQAARSLHRKVDAIMQGFGSLDIKTSLLQSYVGQLKSEALVSFEFRETLSNLSANLPTSLSENLSDSSAVQSPGFDFVEIQRTISTAISCSPLDAQEAIGESVKPLVEILNNHKDGCDVHVAKIMRNFLDEYYQIEKLSESDEYPQVILGLREKYEGEPIKILTAARAVANPVGRAEMALCILNFVDTLDRDIVKSHLVTVIQQICRLESKFSMKVVSRAREVIKRHTVPSLQSKRDYILKEFVKVGKSSEPNFKAVEKLINTRYSILDIIPHLFFDSDFHIRTIATYVYILRTNQAYTVHSVKHHYFDSFVAITWVFFLSEQNFFEPTSAHQDASLLFDTEREKEIFLVRPRKLRKGVLFMCNKLWDVPTQVKKLECISNELGFPTDDESKQYFSCYATVALRPEEGLEGSDSDVQQLLQAFVLKHLKFYGPYKIQRITFMILSADAHPRYFTFKNSDNYNEDPVVRHIDPFMTHRLELERLANFNILEAPAVVLHGLRIFFGVSKENPSDFRFFVRGIVHPQNVSSLHDYIFSEAYRLTEDILDALDALTKKYPDTDCNHVLLHFVPHFGFSQAQAHEYLELLIRSNLYRLMKLRVTEVELCYMGTHPISSNTVPIRMIIEIKTPFSPEIHSYAQEFDSNGELKLKSWLSVFGPANGLPVYRLHLAKQAIQPKRYKAHLLGTTYCYDFIAVFQEALKQCWIKCNQEVPEILVKSEEFALNSNGNLELCTRPPGLNKCGIIVFKMTLFSPEYPVGRNVILIVNDITFQMGSFGPQEDKTFLKATQLARSLGIPRIYISANSGARIGLANEVLGKFKVAWIDNDDPSKGFEYLYLDKSDYEELNSNPNSPSVTAELIHVNEQKRFKLTSIIGIEDGLGVENLSGSGEIAGETSRAYKDIFTITLVTCRSVGIGAYLVRLGQRVIQVDCAPIILTGAAALNKVLGRQVYSSNIQLGGTRIMYNNGITHLKVTDDLEGVSEILCWLAYVPCQRDGPLPLGKCIDPVDRDIGVTLSSTPRDPRILIEGETKGSNWISGFFDRDSFKETMAGWAKGVVVGRARLGGIPVGCISVETRPTNTTIWADPALESSAEETVKEAGQVWYPNSAFKTAQAIKDINYGEQLPLIIFANWRGFSGGQSDMFKEILKFGAEIVDALENFRQPVFIYVVGELRGGAWVVVDRKINPDVMEMYCTENARGGVLEPSGIVEIKYRSQKVVAAMERLDSRYKSLRQSQLNNDSDEIKEMLKAREKMLFPVFQQAATELADLHDRPERMLSKGVVTSIVNWKESRSFFYHRISRRLEEFRLLSNIKGIDSSISHQDATKLLARWCHDDGFNATDDVNFKEWIISAKTKIDQRIEDYRNISLQKQIISLCKQSPTALVNSLTSIMAEFTAEEKELFLSHITDSYSRNY